AVSVLRMYQGRPYECGASFSGGKSVCLASFHGQCGGRNKQANFSKSQTGSRSAARQAAIPTISFCPLRRSVTVPKSVHREQGRCIVRTDCVVLQCCADDTVATGCRELDRKSTRLNSSHVSIS